MRLGTEVVNVEVHLLPTSSSTLLGHGKVKEIDCVCSQVFAFFFWFQAQLQLSRVNTMVHNSPHS